MAAQRLCGAEDALLEGHLYALNRINLNEQAYKDRIHQRLSERCEFDAASGCWIYVGSWDDRGLGKIRVGARSYTVARVSAWLYFTGFELWSGHYVIHTCRSPACFAPEHLEVHPSQAAALVRMRQLGLWGSFAGRGERSRPGPRFTFEQATQIRRRLAAGETRGDLARELGVRTYAVTRVELGITWVKDYRRASKIRP